MADKDQNQHQPDDSLEETRPGRAVQAQRNRETGRPEPSATAKQKRDVGTPSPKGDPGREGLHGPLHDDQERSGPHTDQ